MPESLIIKLPKPAEGELTTTRNVEIALSIDGTTHKLTRVRRFSVWADAEEDELIHVDLTMYSPTFDEEIRITRFHAEAIRNAQTDQGLAFLMPADRKAIRDMRSTVGFPSFVAVLEKIVAEFDRHERELAEIPF